MTTGREEIGRLLAFAKKSVERIDARNFSHQPRAATLLLFAYRAALYAEVFEADVRGDFDKSLVAYAKSVCRDAGADPDCMASNIPTVVTHVCGVQYQLPVLDYFPRPLWHFVYGFLPPMPVEKAT